MLEGMLSRVGIGAATVDTRLLRTTVFPGDTISGEIAIQGGQVAQAIQQLYLRIMTRYKTDQNTHNLTLAEYALADALTVEPGAVWQRSFEVLMPYTTPLTLRHTPVFAVTGLDIPYALDPKDKDMLRVEPHPLQARVLEALEELGFKLWQAETEYHPHRSFYGSPLVQELEFHAGRAYQRRLRELEVVFRLDESGLNVFLEIDRRARGLGLFFESLNEHHASLRFTNVDLQRSDWTTRIQAAIDARL
jgi:sporulation-control protein